MAKITMREAISQALMEEMDRDPAVFIIGEEASFPAHREAIQAFISQIHVAN